MAARGASALLVQGLKNSSVTARSLSTTRVQLLPRQGLPKPPPLRLPSTSTSSSSPSSSSSSREEARTERQNISSSNLAHTSNSKSDLAWFLQDDEDVEVIKQVSDSSSSFWSSPGIFLPEPLSSLHELLLAGESSALIARPDEDGGMDSSTRRKPIVYIHAKEKSEDAWTDWIVVVQVKSNAGGSVSRVAREIGTFLKHVRPPTVQSTRLISSPAVEAKEQQAATSIEDFLGKESAPNQSPVRKNKSREIEHMVESQDSPPDMSPTEKKRWQPFKIISRDAQDGIRLLHSSDPEKWSRKMLSEQFKISQESVRRILKSKWRPTASVVGRQNRRAMEREVEKRGQLKWMTEEQEEVASIRREMERDNQGVEEDEQEYRLQGEEEEDVEDRYTHPVFYEGLVHSGEDRSQGKGKSAVTRGDGEWCLVDAGWCVVHVMTARARKQYDVESIASTKVENSLQESSVA